MKDELRRKNRTSTPSAACPASLLHSSFCVLSFPMYVELHAASAFSFLRGASLPEHLAGRAAELHLPAMALLDRDGVYSAPRFYAKANQQGVRPLVGAEVTLADGSVL